MAPFSHHDTFDVLVSCSHTGGTETRSVPTSPPWANTCNADARWITRLSTYHPDPRLINVVVMDLKMWMAIRQHPLKWRLNLIIDEENHDCNGPNIYDKEDVFFAKSLDQGLSMLVKRNDIGNVFVIGSTNMINSAMQHSRCQNVHVCYVNYPEAVSGSGSSVPFYAYFDLDTLRTNFKVMGSGSMQGQHAGVQVKDGDFTLDFISYTRISGSTDLPPLFEKK